MSLNEYKSLQIGILAQRRLYGHGPLINIRLQEIKFPNNNFDKG